MTEYSVLLFDILGLWVFFVGPMFGLWLNSVVLI